MDLIFDKQQGGFSLDAMDGEILQQKTTYKGRKNSKIQALKRQEGGRKYLWNISEPIQGTGHHGAKAKGNQRHSVYMCGVAQHTEDTPGRSRQGTKPCTSPTK